MLSNLILTQFKQVQKFSLQTEKDCVCCREKSVMLCTETLGRYCENKTPTCTM